MAWTKDQMQDHIIDQVIKLIMTNISDTFSYVVKGQVLLYFAIFIKSIVYFSLFNLDL